MLTTTITASWSGLSGSAPFALTSFSFIALTAGSLKFYVGTTSADNMGPLVASVNLDISAVPLPAGGVLLLAGLGARAGLRRKRGV